MAYFGDETEDKRKGLPALDAPAPASTAPPVSGAPAAAGGAPAAPAPQGGGQAGTGFINLERYLGANREGGASMANQVASDITQQAQSGMADANALKSASVRNSAENLQAVNPTLFARAGTKLSGAAADARAASDPTGGGLGAVLAKQFGQSGGYGSGMRGFDAFLARGAGGDTLDGLSQYGGLDSYMGAMSAGYRPSAPGSKPFTQGPQSTPKGIGFEASDVGPGDYVNPDDERDRWGNTRGG